ncbi:hypothetical protein BSL78_29610 [Apostichopus japonicus]|uniref:Uncharacterized protein n=1 Tax=Stichopus japonicus TaxID=307972 RepID=A0A2G8JCV4_STIJA|nr:hypothetical protein BSL78_29610 [Apostichopus japonicus]
MILGSSRHRKPKYLEDIPPLLDDVIGVTDAKDELNELTKSPRGGLNPPPSSPIPEELSNDGEESTDVHDSEDFKKQRTNSSGRDNLEGSSLQRQEPKKVNGNYRLLKFAQWVYSQDLQQLKTHWKRKRKRYTFLRRRKQQGGDILAGITMVTAKLLHHVYPRHRTME